MRPAYHQHVHEVDKLIAACRGILAAGKRGVVITVVGTVGSTYRRAGARAVIDEDGNATGLVSGGCVENELRTKRFTERQLITYDATREGDMVFGFGSGCRGVLQLLIEPFDAANPPELLNFKWNGREPVEWTTTLPNGESLVELVRPQRALAIFGRGADVEPVVRLAESLGWRVDRNRDAIDHDAAVVMHHNFLKDAAALESLLKTDIAYIGLLGPKIRGEELLAHLGVQREPRIHSPIGLDLGGETPEDIALSIVAEVQAVLNRRTARALRDSDAPIHEPACV